MLGGWDDWLYFFVLWLVIDLISVNWFWLRVLRLWFDVVIMVLGCWRLFRLCVFLRVFFIIILIVRKFLFSRFWSMFMCCVWCVMFRFLVIVVLVCVSGCCVIMVSCWSILFVRKSLNIIVLLVVWVLRWLSCCCWLWLRLSWFCRFLCEFFRIVWSRCVRLVNWLLMRIVWVWLVLLVLFGRVFWCVLRLVLVLFCWMFLCCVWSCCFVFDICLNFLFFFRSLFMSVFVEVLF